MTAPKIPPAVASAAREVFSTLGRIGYRALSAGVAEALRAGSEITTEIDARVKRGARAARNMADGKPYEPEEDDDDAR
jgi:hypothetical protein